MTPPLKYYKIHGDNVPDLTFGTEQSACFDLRAYLKVGKTFAGFTPRNEHMEYQVEPVDPFHISKDRHPGSPGFIILWPGCRAMVPSGIILDIPEGYSVRVHPRSGMAGKLGIVNPNLEGVIDSDYFNELHLLITNLSHEPVKIGDGDRILQAEMVPVLKYDLSVTREKPTARTSRNGGFGSTGTN